MRVNKLIMAPDAGTLLIYHMDGRLNGMGAISIMRTVFHSLISKAMVIMVLVFTLLFINYPADAKNLRFDCHFQKYSTPEGVKIINDEFKLEFTLDTVTGDAVLVGNNGMSKVFPEIGSDGVTFLERLSTGVVQSTTVSRLGQAVHSRHTIINGEIVPTQYYGGCK